MTDHYDVIVIGSGAGGGTLAHTLAGIRQADPAARARRLPPAGDGQLGPPAGVRRRQVHLGRHVVRRRRRAVPAAGPLQRRWGDEAVRRRAVPAAPGGLRRAAPRRRRLTGVAADLRRLRAVVLAGRVAVPGPRQRRRGPHRRAPLEALSRGRPCPTNHGSSSCPTSWPPAATTRSTPRAASCSTRPTGPRARASAARGATATRAWCTPSPTPRRSPCARCSTCPNVTLLVDAEVTWLRDRRRGARR